MKQSVGDTIRDRRIQMGLSQAVVAKKLGILQSTLGNIERGVRQPTPEEVKALKQILGPMPITGTANPKVVRRSSFGKRSVPPIDEPQPIDEQALRDAVQVCRDQYAELMEAFDRLLDVLANKRRKRIYVVQQGTGGPIKIGTSFDPKMRIRHLQTGAVEGLKLLIDFDGDEIAEGKLHARFAQHRIAGEWFSPAPEVLSWIKSIGGDIQSNPAQDRKDRQTTFHANDFSFYPLR